MVVGCLLFVIVMLYEPPQSSAELQYQSLFIFNPCLFPRLSTVNASTHHGEHL